MRSVLLRCYPARWRARYGDEFGAILEERPLGPFDVLDILLGAIDAQLRSSGRGAGIREAKGFSMSLRIGGIAAILAAPLLALAWFLGYGLMTIDPVVPGVLLLAGLSLLLVAVAGLTAFQARTDPHVTWAAFAVPAIGLVVFVIGAAATVVTGDDYWELTMLGVLTGVVGSALFAIVTYRTAVLSRGAAMLIGVGSVLPFVAGVTSVYALLVVAIICFLLGWFALGVQAIRLDRPMNEPRPA
ncbi:MAG: hypothetical protein H0V74_08310 [Chloroflexi bacterium]|nr:hypothetical protein [Chloroflexota bacterium]